MYRPVVPKCCCCNFGITRESFKNTNARGSHSQTLKDVTPGIMTFEVLQVLRMDRIVWDPQTES